MVANMSYPFIKALVGVLATVGLYSVLYKENKFYRFFEHVFLGLATGWTIFVLWAEVLKPSWYEKMMGTPSVNGGPATDGQWAYILLLPLGLMAYFVFSKKHNWMSRIPIGIILGLWSGQQVQVWFNTYGPQIKGAMKPILPSAFSSFTVPANASAVDVYPSQALSNLLYIVTLLSVLSYFLFSFEVKNKAIIKFNMLGRYLLMIGFGAIFGSTVMTRFTLLIDRMYFIWIEFFQQQVLGRG